MSKIKLNRFMCYVAGCDAGNASMRRACRLKWSGEDYNIAAKETNRLLDILDQRQLKSRWDYDV